MKQHRFFKIFGFVILILVVARLALPWELKRYFNKTLNEIPGYHGHVQEVGVSLWRGAYQIVGMALYKNGLDSEPLFAFDSSDIEIDWHAIWHKRIVCRIRLIHPELQFVVRKSKETSQTKVDSSWQDKVRKIVPLDINRFRISRGVVRYKDETTEPAINFYVHEMQLNAENISNARNDDAKLPTPVTVQAKLMKTGNLKVEAETDFLSDPIEGKMKLTLAKLALKDLNDVTMAKAHFDFAGGEFELAMEIAATKTRYDGYIKPLFRGVNVLDLKKEEKKKSSLGHILWEGMVGAIFEIFKNHKHDQFATKIPISGDRNNPDTDTWSALGSLLSNGFIKALSAQPDNSVSFSKDAKEDAKKKTPGSK